MTLFQERPISPMMAKTGEPFDSDNHIFETKWDGLRAILYFQNGKLELQNRNLRDVTMGYPEIVQSSNLIKAGKAIMDGEVVVLNEKGLPDFGRMQTRFGHIDKTAVEAVRVVNPATYVAFDLLHVDGRDIINDPLVQRKEKLRKILNEGPHMMFGEHTEKRGREFYANLLELGFEGTMAKEKDSQYLRGVRSSAWVKVKGTQTVDAIVVGYSAGEGARAPTFGSLIMAMYDKKGELVHVGNVGGGFNEKALEEIRPRLDKLATKTPLLEGPIDAPTPVVWVKPRIVAEVLYANFTRDHRFRFPRFQRLRPDKSPEDCVLDEDIIPR